MIPMQLLDWIIRRLGFVTSAMVWNDWIWLNVLNFWWSTRAWFSKALNLTFLVNFWGLEFQMELGFSDGILNVLKIIFLFFDCCFQLEQQSFFSRSYWWWGVAVLHDVKLDFSLFRFWLFFFGGGVLRHRRSFALTLVLVAFALCSSRDGGATSQEIVWVVPWFPSGRCWVWKCCSSFLLQMLL